MAKKLSKSSKQILSVLFHLVVLACMVLVFDLVKPLIDKVIPEDLLSSKEQEEEVQEKTPSIQKEGSGIYKEGAASEGPGPTIQKESAAVPSNPQAGGGKKPTGGTTMEDLMAQKKERQKKKAEQQKKEE